MKTCTKCNQELPTTHFGKHSKTRDGLSCECKDCKRARDQARRLADPEAHAKRNAEWRRRNRDKATAYDLKWRATREGQESYQKANAKWVERNIEKVRLLRRAKKARRRQAWGEGYGARDIEARHEAQGGACLYCLEPVALEDAHVDHYIPLSSGGRNDVWNIVIACPSCNLTKQAQAPYEFTRSMWRTS